MAIFHKCQKSFVPNDFEHFLKSSIFPEKSLENSGPLQLFSRSKWPIFQTLSYACVHRTHDQFTHTCACITHTCACLLGWLACLNPARWEPRSSVPASSLPSWLAWKPPLREAPAEPPSERGGRGGAGSRSGPSGTAPKEIGWQHSQTTPS